MSCNSTYLLDHETDHGVKADELAALLEDLFEDPEAKVVVFSAWLGTHELIHRRLGLAGTSACRPHCGSGHSYQCRVEHSQLRRLPILRSGRQRKKRVVPR